MSRKTMLAEASTEYSSVKETQRVAQKQASEKVTIVPQRFLYL